MDQKAVKGFKEHFEQQKQQAENAYQRAMGALQALDLVEEVLKKEKK